MKGKQLAMDSALEDLDRYELEREKRETEAVKAMLDMKYRRANANELRELPAGSVIIIGQSLFRKNHYAWHFYRTVMNFSRSCADPHKPIFVQADNEEWPDIPPWAQVVNHEDELRDIDYFNEHIHWVTGEVVEPIVTWWQKKWDM